MGGLFYIFPKLKEKWIGNEFETHTLHRTF